MEPKENVFLEGRSQQALSMAYAVDNLHTWLLPGSCPLQPPHFLPFPKTRPLYSNTNLA